MQDETPKIQLSEQQRSEYRERLLAALKQSRQYDGSEQAFNDLMQVLHDLEQWMGKLGDSQRVTDEMEKAISLAARGETAKSININSLLDAAINNLTRLLKPKDSPENIASSLGIIYEKEEKVIVPPQTQDMDIGDKGGQLDEIKFEPRLQTLIRHLQTIGIYTDDIIIRSGVVLPTMMRKLSYSLVEIPKLKKEVLVCNQYGEITFVSQRQLGIDAYVQMNKDQLKATDGISAIRYDRTDQWLADIMKLLLEDVDVNKVVKLDIKNLVKLRNQVKEVWTSEQWVGMLGKPRRGRLDIKCFNGKGLTYLAGVLGVKDYLISRNIDHLRLGACIFGEEDSAIKQALEKARLAQEQREKAQKEQDDLGTDLDIWRDKIKQILPTSKDWLKLRSRGNKKWNVAGKGLHALTTLFGIEGNANAHRMPFLKLGLAIYGEDDPDILAEVHLLEIQEKAQEELSNDPIKWSQEIRKTIPTEEEWLQMTQREKITLLICKHKLRMLCKIIGVDGDPVMHEKVFLQMGMVVFESNEKIQDKYRKMEHREMLQENPHRICDEIRNQFDSGSNWLLVPARQRTSIRVADRGIDWAARHIGIEGDPIKEKGAYLQLGIAVWKEDETLLEAMKKYQADAEKSEELGKDTEKWSKALRDVFDNESRNWVDMTTKERKDFEYAGFKLHSIATIFGILCTKRGRMNKDEHLQLGLRIFGENDALLTKKLERWKRQKRMSRPNKNN